MEKSIACKKMVILKAAIILLILVGGFQTINAQGTTMAKNQFAEINGRKIAYRSIGKGTPIILCNRFRGILDSWDPAFIDGLARNYRVVIFDYTGIGLSTGEMKTEITQYARDVKDLAESLNLKKIILGGWSFGGVVAQSAAVEYPELVSHLILIGTNPPGKNAHQPEQIFIDTSSKAVNDLADETILFFEPKSESSSRAAVLSHQRIAMRTRDLSVPVPEKLWKNYFQATTGFAADKDNYRERLGTLKTPILVLSGDHDIVCPIENWYALTRKLPNMQIIMLPDSGHGPQHQYPELSVKYINAFLQNTK